MISARGVIQSLRTVHGFTNQNHGTVFSQQERRPLVACKHSVRQGQTYCNGTCT
jgi:hypothetical protein